MNNGLSRIKHRWCIAIVFVLVLFTGAVSVSAAIKDDISAREKEIEVLQKQIDNYQNQILETSSKATTLAGEIARLNASIQKLQLEIKSLTLSIQDTSLQIESTQQNIAETLTDIESRKLALGESVRLLDRIEKQNLTVVLFSHDRLSDFFNNVQNVGDAQDTLKSNILALKTLKDQLEIRQDSLSQKKKDLEQLKSLQLSQSRSIASTKGTKDQLYKETKGQEAQYKLLLNQTQQQINQIRSEISALLQTGLTVEDVIKFGQITANKIGIRPEFLIAILDVESRLGANVGTGNWKDDMYLCYIRLSKIYPAKKDHYLQRAETEKAAFFKVVDALGLSADTVKVSREPSYGCGGAMGPAQFIPSTWLGYEAQVVASTGRSPANPWNIEDAFTASAIKLSKGGASSQERSGEIRAAKAYISGNANCSSSICNYYANLVLSKAAVIGSNL